MKKLIVCPKKTGNTYNVCNYVSDNSDIELMTVNRTTDIDLKEYDTIILSSGVYANHVHINILRWIENIQTDKIESNTKIYIFLTWFGRGKSDKSAIKEVKDLLEKKGLKLEDKYCACYGKGMGVIRSSHPDEKDKENILSWAKML